MTLQTITPKHRDLRQITIGMTDHFVPVGVGANFENTVEEPVRRRWLDLDRLFVRLWESRSIHPRIVFTKKQDMRDRIGYLLPEITKGGIIDLVERSYGSE